MAGEQEGQITSADDGTYVPDANGFLTPGPFDFELTNGTTFSGTLEKKSPQGNWATVPDTNSNTTLTGAAAFKVNYNRGGYFRINVTTATGTWDWAAIDHK